MTVLIVDDSPIQRNIVKSYLADVATVKWNFIEAGDGAAALETIDRLYKSGYNCDLVLLDWNMPKMTGVEFLKDLRLDSRFDGIKVIMVTSDGNKSHVLEAIKSGAQNFILKPVNTASLMEKINPLFGYNLPES